MTEKVRLTPCPPIDANIRPPGSKSITNRAVICAALANGTSELTGVLTSEDTEVMIAAWQQLGLPIEHDEELATLQITGCGGKPSIRSGKLFIANSGTTIRFLSAALAACGGEYELDGVERMRQRPIADLLAALRELGADAVSLNSENADCPPVSIHSQGLIGGKARVAGNISSQFLSGLMMAAPLAQTSVTLEVEGELVSIPYVEMTRRVMESFGAKVNGPSTGPIEIDCSKRYQGQRYAIEPDASAASYFWAAAAVAGGRARVTGLSRRSLQGDVNFCGVLEQMGCQRVDGDDFIEIHGGKELVGVNVDMADISDTVQTLAAVALFAKGPTTVRGVAHNRVKETDRISDLATELRKLGAEVEEFEDGFRMIPPAKIQPAEIETYQDHRMAMSLALVGLRAPGIVLRDPQCTRKTYPNYWEDLQLFSNCRLDRFE